MQYLQKLSTRKIFLIIAILCGVSIAYSFYAEFILNFEPCPLCIVQRLVIIIISLLSIVYTLHNPSGWLSKIYQLIIIGLAIFNIKIALRHMWIMSLPPELQPTSCGMPLDILYNKVPLKSFLHTVLQGDAECGKVSWTILGITPPTAVIILCGVITILSIIGMFKKNK